jgi:hypothetical protein
MKSRAGAYPAAILLRRNSTSASKAKGKVRIAGAPAVHVLMMRSNILRTGTSLLDPHQRLGGSAGHKRKLILRLDGVQRLEQRLDQRSRSMIVALVAGPGRASLIGYGG